ncbi:MAG TPA: substrate-binding domain-containing protein [Thermoleophilaceae bacterium]
MALALVAVAVALVAAGCGSSDNKSSSNNSSAASTTASSAPKNSGLAQAQAFMKASMNPPSTLGLTPTGKPIPQGKTVTYVHCGVDVCTTIGKAIKNAADVLGWKTKVIPSDGSPGSVKQAWDTVVRMKPAAAFGSGFPSAMYASEVKQLKADGIPVMLFASTDVNGNGVTLSKGRNDEVPIVGKQMASWVIATTNGKPNTLYVDLPAFPILPPVRSGFEAAYKQWCPDCPYAKIDLPITSIGKDAPSRIVSYLRAHPDVNRVALGYDGLGFGLPAALKSAGLADKVQFIGEAPTETNFAYVRAGQEGATVSQGYYEIWSNLLDAAARTLTKQSITANNAWKVPWFLVTKDNINSAGTGFGPVVPNLTKELDKLWNKA